MALNRGEGNGEAATVPVQEHPGAAPSGAGSNARDGDHTGDGTHDGRRSVPVAAEDAVVVEGPAEEEHPSAGEGRLNIWLFRPDSEPASVPLDEAPGLVRDDANFVWVSLTGYAEADLREVARLLNLDSEAVRGTLSSWRRPHVRLYPGHAYVSVTVAQLAAETRRVEARQLDLFVGRNFLVSAHKLPLPFSGALESRAQHSPDLVRLDSGFMLFMVLDELLGYLEGLTEHLGDEIEAMEQRALRDAPDDFLEDLLQLKRYVFAIMRLTEQHRQVFTAFLRPDWQFDAEDHVRPYYQYLLGRLER